MTTATAEGGNGYVTVEWEATPGLVPDDLPSVNGYRVTVFAGANTVVTRWSPGPATEMTLGGLAPGTYTVSVEPSNSFGRGAAMTTDPVTVTSGDADGYASAIRQDAPKLFYRLGESPGAHAFADSSGRAAYGLDLPNNGKLAPGASGSLHADPDGAATLSGWQPSTQTLVNGGLPTGDTSRSVEWWVRGASDSGPWSFTWGNFSVTGSAQSVSVGPNTVGFTQNILDNNWHHLVATYDPAASRLVTIYIDGNEVASGNGSTALTNADAPFKIAGQELSSATNVTLDDVAIYDSVLSLAQVQSHFNASGNTRPTGVTDVTVAGGTGTITLGWGNAATANTPYGQAPLLGYRIVAKKGSSSVLTRWLSVNDDSLDMTGLPTGDYTVDVTAANGFGFGDTTTSSAVSVADGGSDYQQTIQDDAPLSYYRFGESGGAPKLGDSSGRDIPLLDLPTAGLALGENGALTGDPDWSVGLTNNDAAATGIAAGLPAGNTARSVEWWMKSTAGTFTARWGGSIVRAGATTITLSNGGTVIATTAVPNLSNNAWRHVVLTYTPSGRVVKVYVDGTLADQVAASADIAGTNGIFQLGANGQAFTGKVDELAVYPNALDVTRVQAHYVAGQPEATTPPATVQVTPRPHGGATVSWRPPPVTPNSRQPDAYEIVRRKNGVVEQTKRVSPRLTRVDFTNLSTGHDYDWFVEAIYGDFRSHPASTPTYTPHVTAPASSPVTFNVGVAYKEHNITEATDDPEPCGESPETIWLGSTTCGASYGGGLIAVQNTSATAIPLHIAATYPAWCNKTMGVSFAQGLQPGQTGVAGGFLRSFDAVSCPGAEATIEITIGAQQYVYTDGGYMSGSVKTKPWHSLSGNGDLFASAAAESGEGECFSADPVDMRSGAYLEHHCLIALPNRGVPLRFDIGYDSRKIEQDGPVGYGWSTGVDASISVDARSTNRVIVRQEDGSVITLDTVDGTNYSPLAGTYATMTRSANGFRLVRRNRDILTFDNSGRLTSHTDLNDEGLTYQYDAESRVSNVVATSGEQIVIEYAPNSGRIATVTGSLGRHVDLEYDANGNLESYVDQANEMTSFTYNADHTIATVTGPNGPVTSNTYDASRRVVSQLDPAEQTTTFTYTATTTTTTAPGADGPVATRYEFNNDGLVTAITRANGTASAQTTQYEYTPGTREKAKVTGPDGRFVTATYDARGNQLTVTDEAGRTTTRTYDALNNVTSHTSPTGLTSQYTYNSSGNITSVNTPKIGGGWHTTTFTYADPTHPGDVTSLTSPRGAVTTKEYDNTGNLTRVEQETGAVTTATYNAAGQTLTVTSPEGNEPGAIASEHTLTYNYLPDGRPTGSSDPDGASTIAVYGPGSRVGATTGPDGTSQAYDYDDLGRRVATHHADGATQSLTYDPAGNQTSVTDANGHETTYTYDNLDRLRSKTDAQGRSESYTYDAANRLATVTRPDSSVVTLTYDNANQLTTVDYPGTAADVSYTYNADGHVTSMTDTTGTTSYRVNSVGVVDRVNGPAGLVDYGFDADGSLVSTTYPSGRVVTRDVDSSGRITGISDGTGGAYTFDYDINDRLTTVTFPNDVTTTVERDALGQTASVTTASLSGTLFDAQYEHDDDSGLLAGVDESGQAALDQQYGYNVRDRMTASGPAGAIEWDVDDAGNLVDVRGQEQTFDDSDRPLTLETSNGLTTFGYDGRGNRTSGATASGTTTYGFDEADRMSTGPDGSVFTFTGDGLRAGSQTGGTGPVNSWVWDQSTGVPALLTDGAREYVYGPAGMVLEDAPIAGTSGGAPVMYLHADVSGSIRTATDTSGEQTWARSFDAYGADAATWNASGYSGPASRFGWHGHYRDDSGLLYVQARVYDPAAGGYLSEDPAVDVTGEAYGYANSNPVAFTDLTGTAPSLQELSSAFGSANEQILSVAQPALAAYQSGTWDAAMGVMDSITLGGFTSWTHADQYTNKCSFWYNGTKIGTDVAMLVIPFGGTELVAAKYTLKAGKLASTAAEAGRVGKAAKTGSGLVDDAASTAAKFCSFSGATLVLMVDGTKKPIEQIEVGDQVLATDPETGEQVAKTVEHVWKHQDTLTDLVVDGEVISTTEDHRFWNATDGEFQRTDKLDPGDQVEAADGRLVRVSGLHLGTERTAAAYNLTVEGIHTYHVGDSEILVHNDCGPLLTRQFDAAGKRITNAPAATTAQTDDLASYLGYVSTGRRVSGQVVYRSGRSFITQDATSHNGGFWKMADSIENLRNRSTRLGTYDFLLRRVGP